MKIVISNSSHYTDRQVNWLVMFAAKYVRAEADRMGWGEKFDYYPTSIRVTHTRHSMCGRYLNVPLAMYIARPFKWKTSGFAPDDKVRDILCRIGEPKRFPKLDVYPRFKDMPEEMLNDWCEALVSITAHELSHTKFSGGREGEYNCELIAHDAVRAFRLARAEFDAAMAKGTEREQEQELRMAAKQAPEAVREQKLQRAVAALAKWKRKFKLAQTKLKKYQRQVNRLNKQIEQN